MSNEGVRYSQMANLFKDFFKKGENINRRLKRLHK